MERSAIVSPCWDEQDCQRGWAWLSTAVPGCSDHPTYSPWPQCTLKHPHSGLTLISLGDYLGWQPGKSTPRPVSKRQELRPSDGVCYPWVHRALPARPLAAQCWGHKLSTRSPFSWLMSAILQPSVLGSHGEFYKDTNACILSPNVYWTRISEAEPGLLYTAKLSWK